MTDERQLKILRRVRKMMKLANDAGASEGERDNAMRMVHATLAKYNIAMSLVDAGDAQTEEKRESLRKAFLGKPWAIQIAAAIARMYFCHYHYSTMGGNAGPTQKALHVFVGRESNVVTAQEMAQFVVESVNREAQRYQRSIGGRYGDYRAFAQGAAQRIRERCYQIEQDAKTKGVEDVPTDEQPGLLTSDEAFNQVPGTALVLASLYKTEDDANTAFVAKVYGKLGKGRSSTFAPGATTGNARSAGAKFGSKVSLHKQIKDKE